MTKEEVLVKCKRDLEFFGRVISPQTFYLRTPEFHSEVDELLGDNSVVQLLIEAPRGTAKSTKTTTKILHHSIYDQGDKFVVIQSYTLPEAINRLTKIKNVIEYGQGFRDLYGYCGEQAAEVWRENKIKTKIGKYKVTIKALGTGQPVRGSLEEDTRITLYILDDPDNEESCITKEQMDKNFDKFLGGLAGLDRRNGRVIVIGTPIRQGCIVDRLESSSGWVVRKYQSFDPATKKVLWDEMYSYDWLMAKKREWEEMGKLSKFYSEYQCQIIGDEERIFNKFRIWDGDFELKDDYSYLVIKELDGIALIEPKIVAVNTFVGIDPASSTKKTADFSVTFPIAYDNSENIYTLDYYRRRVEPLTHAEQIIESIKQHKYTNGHVETVAYQEFLRQYLRQRLGEENLYLPGLETKFQSRTEKSARLDTLQPHFGRGKVFIKKGQQEFIDELLMYPRGKHEDLMDGFYFATRRLVKPEHLYLTEEQLKQRQEDDLKYFLTRGGTSTAWAR